MPSHTLAPFPPELLAAKKQIRETGEDGEGLATAGIIVGWIGFGLSIAFILFYVVLIIGFGIFASSSSSSGTTY